MKLLIKKSEIKRIQEHPGSTFHEYNLPFQNVSVGVSEISGRYPHSGFDVDQEVEQVWYIEQGKGRVWLLNSFYELSEGDMVLIPKGEKYWIEGTNLKLVVVSSPPWFPKQHTHISK
ncbi:hypothetical protein A2866_05965 [Candidatus Roizmanbacteria bacterium RIFCSPHIGHO2_01_FULL_39_8]|uniref:AraC-type arabinose-binding/dimerisation domain-containing protein n=2 Tax=Candidatus Roizmaniibacteriota TaxID=1752723 RepID=A0A1F7GFL1_9BACT|nr:MAG: hypothetical protein A2866_05965 [Candidatus Roizmanbacteria bacterium RIFCSPHIGHO2_01_FULL_39_8]OGK25621.1 MAG: hypothetical protein A3C28_00420 [Candidatus Roizmanbacteria bacterium RIFCSPHIGHO2_02_FULL_39_9]